MEQNIQSSAYGTALFKVKYRTVELQTGPSYTATSLGTLKRGAVVTVIEDSSRYFYKVRLDNGLEGYVYKPAGETTSGLGPTPMPTLTMEVKAEKNGYALPSHDIDGAATNGKLLNGNGSANHNGKSLMSQTSVYNLGPLRYNGTNKAVEVTSGEIAALDQPGITGRQVAKLRRGDVVSVVNEDSFFYQVSLPNGIVGYIPRYAAELRR